MKKLRILSYFLLIAAGCLSLSSCARPCSDDCYGAENSVGGKHGDAKKRIARDDFMCYHGTYGTDYIPLRDEDLPQDLAFSEMRIKQPKESPGDPGSSIPGIDRFQDPQTLGDVGYIFRKVHFPYNSNMIKGSDNLQIVRDVAKYMKGHPETYIFVAGHCDERGAEAYNLALGSRRSNAVRALLVSEGVDPNHVFTISYGKERPEVYGHDEEAWATNRRAEFKIYKR